MKLFHNRIYILIRKENWKKKIKFDKIYIYKIELINYECKIYELR